MKRVGVLVIGAAVLLGACGSSGPQTAVSDATIITSPTTAPPTTASATAAPVVTVIVTVEVTAATTVTATTTASIETIPLPTAAPLPPATMPKPKPTTTPKTTTPKTTVAATSPVTTTPVLYKSVNAPILPKDHTSEVPADGELPNGAYWVTYSGGDKLTPTVDVREAYFGDACIAKATEDGATCEDDIYIPDTPDREMTLTLAGNVRLTVSDALTQKSYQVTPDELVRIRASSPSDGAPENFSFTPFAFLATVSGGKVTKFEQVWTP